MKKYRLHLISCCICMSLATACSVQNNQTEELGSKQAVAAETETQKAADENKLGITEHNIHFPLKEAATELEKLAELEEHAIAIYTDADGKYVISINNLQYAFDWTGLTPSGTLPRLSYEDFDHDGTLELAVVLYTGSGTGIAIEELHMLKVNPDGSLTDHMYNSEQYINALQEQLAIELDQQEQTLHGIITYNDQQATVDLTVLLDDNYGGVQHALSYGNIVYFSVEQQQIIGTFKANVTVANWATPIVIGEVLATIRYENEAFTLHIDAFTPEQQIE